MTPSIIILVCVRVQILQHQSLRKRALFGPYQSAADFRAASTTESGTDKRPQLQAYMREKYHPFTTAQYWEVRLAFRFLMLDACFHGYRSS
jgi:hypothetical protein